MILIPATKSAATTDWIKISRSQVPVTFVATGLGVAETIAFNATADNGATFEAIAIEGPSGNPATLNVDENALSVNSPVMLRLVKQDTVADCTVAMYGNELK